MDSSSMESPQKAEADKFFEQGIEQFQTRQFTAALQSWQQALLIYREIKDPQLKTAVLQSQGEALRLISSAYFNLEDYAKAIEYSEQFLAIARDIKDPKLEVIALGSLASASLASDNLQKAVNLREEQQETLKKLKLLG